MKLMCATQNPSDISSGLMNNLIIKYIFGLEHGKEINVIMDEFSSYKGYPDHSPAEIQMMVKDKLQRMAKDERYVGCCFYSPRGMP